jgi:hypothetical protein
MSDHTRLDHPVPRSMQWLPSCRICKDPVLLETSKTDEYGQAVHEECYVHNLSLKAQFLNDGGSVPGPANRHATYQPCEATMAEIRDSRICRESAVLATMHMPRAKHVSWHKQPWGVDLAAVVTILVLTCWIAYSDRHPALFLGSLAVQRSVAVDEQVPLPTAKARRAKGSSKLPAVPVPVEEARTATLLPEVGGVENAENQVVHIGEDVTVRYFNAPHPGTVEQYQVVHIGEDVTVRYFTPIGRHTTN